MSKEIPFEKSFASHEKSKFWSDKNRLKPDKITLGTKHKYWFDCKCRHIFDISIIKITTRNQWCPYCCNNSSKICSDEKCNTCFEKSFASHEKSIYWSNENIKTPRQVFKSSGDKYYFDCIECKHTFDMSLNGISSDNSWCSYCANKKLCDDLECKLCFEKSFESHEKSIYWSNNNELKPRQVFKFSNKKYLFDCNICNHEIDKNINSISTNNHWCAYCTNQKLCNNKECKLCFKKSFASHEKSKYWSIKNVENPRQIFKGTNYEYLFNCDICNHEFEIKISNIASKNNWCNYCSNKYLCNNKDCKICFEKSFASHEKSKYWSIKNVENPRQVFKGSQYKYLFNCNICNHEFDKDIGSINNDGWCPYCVNKKLCDNLECNICLEKSFATHEKSIYWSNKNELKPRQVFKFSSKICIFNCDICNNDYSAVLYSILNGSWCSCTKNKTEKILYDKFKDLYNITIQFKKEWCKIKNKLPFDFCIEEYNIIIEIDGRQHFEQVENWDNPEYTNNRDKFKMKCANENNYSVIRILQQDIWRNKFNWIDEIKQSIQKIIDDKIIQNIFICKNNEYDIFNNI